MDEENINISTGDLLGATSFNENIDNRLRDIEKKLSESVTHSKSIDSAVISLVKEFKNSNKSNFNSGISDKVSKTSQQKSGGSSNSFKSSAKSSGGSGVAGQILDGLEESLCEALGIPYIGNDVKSTIEDVKNEFVNAFADSIGVPSENLVQEIVKSLATEKFNSLDENSALKQKFKEISNQFSGITNDAYNSLIDAIQKSSEEFSDPNIADKFNVNMTNMLNSVFGKDVPNLETDQDRATREKLHALDKYDIDGKQSRDGINSWDPLFDYLDRKFDPLYKEDYQGKDVQTRVKDQEDFQIEQMQDLLNSDEFSDLPDIVQQFKDSQDYLDLDDAGKNSVDDLLGDLMDGKSGKRTTTLDKDKLSSLVKGDVKDAAGIVKGKVSSVVDTKVMGQATKALGSLGKGALSAIGPLAKFVPGIGLAVTAFEAVQVAAGPMIQQIGVAAEKVGKFGDTLSATANQYNDMQQKRVDAETKRFQADVRTMLETPFNILEEAAKKVYAAWDESISVINQTQGYDKADLQNLITSFSQRLQSEGLMSVVGSTDITSMLKSILEKGLSGAVAEEFAYISTVLKAAVPTQDFSSYAESYASMVSSFISQGYAQTEALNKANTELQNFVSNTISASRATGGLETGLNDASSLFGNLVKISQNAQKADITKLSQSLAIVQAITGQAAGVGSSIVDNIVQAAIGGNSDNLTALRSLANTGASNTAFLKALSTDPSKVLATLFDNLNNMLDKNADNYMEVAYSLADTFGIDANSLVQVNWDRLVSQLNSGIAANGLQENLNLLKSGESTTSAEAQRLQQINEMMLDQGLAYVLDNEAARAIQEHMWDQELQDQIMEAEYAVNLQGDALSALVAIQGAIDAIIKFLMGPFTFIDQATEIALTAADDAALHDDLKQLIELGKVGNGNTAAFHDLTTYDVKQLTNTPKNLVEMFGGTSSYAATRALHTEYQNRTHLVSSLSSTLGDAGNQLGYALSDVLHGSTPELLAGLTKGGSISSKYAWGGSGKSVSDYLSNTSGSNTQLVNYKALQSDVNSVVADKTAQNLQAWTDTLGDAVKNGVSFDDWWKTSSDYGIANAESALLNYDQSKEGLKSQYDMQLAQVAATNQLSRNEAEAEFWETGKLFWTETYPQSMEAWTLEFNTRMDAWTTTYTTTMENFVLHLDEMYIAWTEKYQENEDITHLNQIDMNTMFKTNFVEDYLKEWKDYYIGNHTNYYNSLGTSAKQLAAVANKEKASTGESVLALAQAISQSATDISDPQAQTNALLAQILIVLEAIMQQGNSTSGLTLPTALAALGLNLGTEQK